MFAFCCGSEGEMDFLWVCAWKPVGSLVFASDYGFGDGFQFLLQFSEQADPRSYLLPIGCYDFCEFGHYNPQDCNNDFWWVFC